MDLEPSLSPPFWIPNFEELGGFSVRNSDFFLVHDPEFVQCSENRKNPNGGFLEAHESVDGVR